MYPYFLTVEESTTVDVYPSDDQVSFTRRSASLSSSLRKQDSYGVSHLNATSMHAAQHTSTRAQNPEFDTLEFAIS